MVLVNGVFTDSIKANDRGLMYGDGVFRTLRIKHGVPLNWTLHYHKLASDCAALELSCPPISVLEKELERASESMQNCIAKIVVTRGAGGRGYLPEAALEPTLIVSTSPAPEHEFQEIRAHLCDLRLSHQPRLAGIKHLNRLENVIARMEWNDPETREGILLDLEGNVIEGTMSSLLLYHDGSVIAPDLSRCGVDGVQRARVLACCAERKIPARIESFGIERLIQADEVFLVNSVIGLWQIVELGAASWPRGKFCEAMRGWLE